MRTIYLCGGINKLSDSEAKDWREAAKSELSGAYRLLDPMRRDYRGKEAESVRAIIDGDIQDINDSDILLVNASRPSWGTAMEVFFAASRGNLLIVTVCPDENPSPWLIGHSTVIKKTFLDAFNYLLDREPEVL